MGGFEAALCPMLAPAQHPSGVGALGYGGSRCGVGTVRPGGEGPGQ